jgi:hypothetical protein
MSAERERLVRGLERLDALYGPLDAPIGHEQRVALLAALRSDPPSTAERIEGELLADVIRAIGRQAEIFGGTALRRLEAKLEKPGTVLILGRAAPPPNAEETKA